MSKLAAHVASSLVTDEFDIPSEVDDFWTRLRTRVVPAIGRKHPGVAIEARLSEPPEIRHRELGHSEDIEMLEIVMPGGFATQTVDSVS